MISIPIERYSTLLNLDYNLTSDIKAFVQVGAAQSIARYTPPQRRDVNASLASEVDFIRIQRDNAYLPADLRNAMIANNVSGFFLGRTGMDLGAPKASTDNSTKRIAVGFEGSVGSWKWDAYFQYGANRNDLRYNHLSKELNFQRAYDAVFNAAGQIVCRVNQVTVTDPACAPINLLGHHPISAAADSYIHGNLFYVIDTTQTVAAANISGDLFSTWAGPVSVAAGVEVRQDEINAVSDATSEAGLFEYQNNKAYSGSSGVREAYVEAVVPLLKDAPLARALDLNTAVRVTDYELSGAVSTWKVGLTYEPTDQVRVRLTRSRDIRAPQLVEMFGYSTTTASATNPFTNANTGPVTGSIVGNADLKPEVADTLTAGVVLSPTFWNLSGLRFSVDYYKIDITEAIASYTFQQILNNCGAELRGGNSTGFFCNMMSHNGVAGPGFNVNGLTNKPLNLTRQTASGFDFEAAYAFPLAGGRMSLRALATNTRDQTNYDVAGKTQNAGYLTAAPNWTANASATYARDRWSVTGQARYIGKVRRDPARVGPDQDGYNPARADSVNDNLNPAFVYFNLSGQYNLIEREDGRRVQLYGVVNNLLSTDPPLAGASFFYDQLGRTYKVGLRMNF